LNEIFILVDIDGIINLKKWIKKLLNFYIFEKDKSNKIFGLVKIIN
jgi:hypothetical protein